MRVLLIYPNAKKEIIGWGDKGAIAEPIALEYVGAGSRAEGHETRLLDLRLHNEKLEDTIREFRPDVIGVTGYSMHVLRNLEVCRIAREIVPQCVNVVGGHHATLEPTDYFEPQVDHVVSGEGVRPFRQILKLIEGGHPVQGVPGTYSRVDGQFQFGGEQGSYDIGAIPAPDRTLALEDRSQYFIDWMKPIALMRTTVGCPYRCTFCSLWRIMDGRYYKRANDAVVEELRTIPEKYVFFVDDEPFVDPKRMWALGKAIEAADLDKNFFAYCRIDSMLRDLDLMRFWHKIGLRRLLFGIETVFDWELKEYNKKQKREEIIRGLAAAREIGISLFCNFIISPAYTHAEFDHLIQFIKDNNVDYPSFTILTPIPGTGQDYKNVLDVQPNGRPNWDYFDLQHAVTQTTMPKKEFMDRFEDLYQVFAGNYAQCESPLTVDSLNEVNDKAEILRSAYIKIAMAALGGRPSASALPTSTGS
jgi:radical SAM superfamily enzyme YgiQ (UPF0313 family)